MEEILYSICTFFYPLTTNQDQKQTLPQWQNIWWGRYPCWVSPDTCECNQLPAGRSHGSADEPFGPAESSSAPAEEGEEIKPTHRQLWGGTAKTNPLLLKSEIRSIRVTQTHLLHDVQLRVLRLKKLDEQLEDLRVQQLVTRTDLCGGSVHVWTEPLS